MVPSCETRKANASASNPKKTTEKSENEMTQVFSEDILWIHNAGTGITM